MSSNEPADLLTVILDLNPLAWTDLENEDELDQRTNLISVLESFLIFANSHLALRHENAIAVYGASLGSSELLYSSLQAKKPTTKTSQPSGSRDANTYQSFRILNDSIVNGVKHLAAQTQSDSVAGKQPGIVKALAKALCHINRVAREHDSKKDSLSARILILSVSSDAPGQYIPMMNCIFSAQKAAIPIDVCKISNENAVFLQQAAHLTEGIYYKVEKPKAILQYLTMIFLPGLIARKVLNLPRHEEVDFRAACFCHREIIDIGYVCSVCLSIFCTPTPVCSTCRTKFPMSTLKRFLMEKPKTRTKSANGTIGTTTPTTTSSPVIP
ncbi:hypothetical protein MJO28_009948 [Puccinia striiformis f. sp. tritici]|uniref:General transcription and DNA repair factor IIH subunit TFB4 n=3 Tax=Puccinia striiformis TaxID=27350 RepID=A0A0L0UTN6_9BASI|nr:hypothetical protein Pst134EA_017228 [Puccinia striiformis f. sp. tritici]KAI9628498.1 hypothetical protein H4Q26_018026 [Puccinia striiformis f. sp. tritici PST-130]KNE90084.1 hypothetical protein PSTG_16461 [Puccinia striiformis f. sp. tritici PST-78]POW00538.1 hypothetical protein PSTT_13092 [Puccinia striiformis]KAH9450626.1 hypothetical protein Pst134EB_018156 [Puccinia striiformis f. sp. tritici]KAH9460916.1 hypothetical protein Pst134EA_017228 [Puccinia striiformis f. sp. tritici]